MYILNQFKNKPKIYNLLESYKLEADEIRAVLYQLKALKNIQIVSGETLNILGDLLNVPRKGRTDYYYRIAILSAISTYQLHGRTNDILSFFASHYFIDRKTKLTLLSTEGLVDNSVIVANASILNSIRGGGIKSDYAYGVDDNHFLFDTNGKADIDKLPTIYRPDNNIYLNYDWDCESSGVGSNWYGEKTTEQVYEGNQSIKAISLCATKAIIHYKFIPKGFYQFIVYAYANSATDNIFHLGFGIGASPYFVFSKTIESNEWICIKKRIYVPWDDQRLNFQFENADEGYIDNLQLYNLNIRRL